MNKTKIFLIIFLVINLSSYIYPFKIFPQLNYKISGKLECMTFIPSNISIIPSQVRVTPISNAQIQLWDEDGDFKIWGIVKK